MAVLNVLCDRAEGTPGDIPFRSVTGKSLSYEEWARSSRALAGVLREQCGVRLNDRVMIVVDREMWLEYAIAYVAVLAAGATVVTARPEEGRASLERSAELTATSLCVFSGARAREVTSGLSRRLELTDTVTGTAVSGTAMTEEAELPEVVELLFTSGTTGRRMAVGCPRADFVDGLRQEVRSPVSNSPRRSVLVHHIPLGTQAAQRVLWEALRASRLTNVYLPNTSPNAIRSAVEKYSATFVGLVPFTARRLVRACTGANAALPSVEWVSVGSSPADDDVLNSLTEVFPNAQVMNMYGLTEAGAARIRGVHPNPPGALGTPEPGTRVSIRGDDGAPVPCGHKGDLWISRLGGQARFYVGDPAATAAVFRGDWVRTGDIAWVDSDGYVYLVDRARDIINSVGQKIASIEIETCLRAHELVVEAAVFGTPSRLLGERVVAAVVVDQSWSANAEDIQRELMVHCRERLSPYAVPSRFVHLEAMPTGPTGKVLKHVLRKTYSQDLT
ncbi:class I adenylate-forming enzyme family protein [Actinophytocola glycyrrhizae]|uniref:Class I adenylate-forming enzyme family protein n=1 Tax=Actinophytocola glycyrrhizae TaxID=2044873 RepID=A0ABV9SD20_9PSEU